MGVLGQQTHPDVTAAVLRAFEAVRGAGVRSGSTRSIPPSPTPTWPPGRRSCWSGRTSSLLARGSEALAARFVGTVDPGRTSY